MKPAIVIGSHTQVLAVIRALGSMGVPMVVMRYHHRDFACGSRWVREVIDCPHPDKQADRFLAQLAGLADRFPGALLVPPSDPSVATLSVAKDSLTQLGFVVAAPDSTVTRICLDKAATYDFARAHGVATPASVPVTGLEDLERFAAEMRFPGVLKASTGHQRRGLYGGEKWARVNDLDHAVTLYKQAREAGVEVVLQEFIPGDERCGANYNAYFFDSDSDSDCADGTGRVEMTAEKIRNEPVDTGSPCALVSRDIPEVTDAGRRMLSALGYRGFANIEFKRDPRDGVYKLIEINARHNLSAMLAFRCGINFPWLEYRHRVCGEQPRLQRYREGVYWVDITRDLKASRSYLRRGDYSLRRFLRPYLSRPVYAVAARDDPRPAVIRTSQTLAQLRDKAWAGAARVVRPALARYTARPR